MSSLRARIALAFSALVLLAIAAVVAAFGRAGPAGVAPILVLVVVLAIGGSILLAFVIAEAVTSPLERLRVAARALAAGNFTAVATEGGGGEVQELAGAFNEMAARLQQTMQSLQQERSRLEALLASSSDAIVALDDDGAVRYLNAAAVALYGNVDGRSFAEIARDPVVTGLLRSVHQSRADAAAVDRPRPSALLYVDERDLWLQATVSRITMGGGWAVLVVLHDVTDSRRAETTRRDFVANVSHELRTPLAGIKAVVETLRDGALDDPHAATAFLSQVDGEVDRLVQLVEELLQLARIESGAETEMTILQPASVLSDCVRRFSAQAERTGVTLTLDVPAELPAVRGNAAQLGQAVGNLVHNALKFTLPGGRVTVSADQCGLELRIRVSDTGVGIDPADLPRIFERFYVADRARSGRGTGLGLAIVKHVVRAHEGTVDAESVLGAGSTFSICLPVAQLTSA